MRLEELSMNAWPALQTLLYDGWVIRFANGYTKRANSINPIYESRLDAAEKIANCERLYRQRNLDVVFKMTAAVHPKNLDEMLAGRGYRVDSPTSVQTAVLNGADSRPSADLATTLTDEWLADFCRMSAVSDERKSTLRQILANIVLPKCFAAIRRGEETIACGLGVLQGEYIGFYDIITAASFRNQGYGKRIMRSLLAWGKQHGAQHGYLQVMLNNAPALHLYAQLGFKEIYQYWYRIKP